MDRSRSFKSLPMADRLGDMRMAEAVQFNDLDNDSVEGGLILERKLTMMKFAEVLGVELKDDNDRDAMAANESTSKSTRWSNLGEHNSYYGR